MSFWKRLFGKNGNDHPAPTIPMAEPATGHPGNGYVVISTHRGHARPRVCISASLVDAARGKICPGDALDLEINASKRLATIYHCENGNKARRTTNDPTACRNLRIMWTDTLGLAEIIPTKTRLPIVSFMKRGGIEVAWPFAEAGE